MDHALKAGAAFGFICAVGGLAGIAFFGDSLTIFYALFAVASLGSLMLLAFALNARTPIVTGVASPVLAVFIFAVAFAMRSLLAARGPQLSFDLNWYADFVTFLRMHATPYTTQFYFPYPQGFFSFLLLFVKAANPAAAIHWVLITTDSLVAAGLFLLLKRTANQNTAFLAALSYAVMPMPVIDVGRIGHFETLISFCFVVLVYALLAKRSLLAGVAITAATLLKVFPAIAFPSALLTWARPRNAVLTAVGVALTVLITLIPFKSDLSPLRAFWFGGTLSSPTAGTFVANSLPALVKDVPAMSFIIPVVTALGALVVLGLVVFAWRERASHRNVDFFQWGRIAMLPFFAVFAIMGIYTMARPWLTSQYAFMWWYPTPELVALGVCLTWAAIVGWHFAWAERAKLMPAQIAALLVCTAITLLVLLHSNVNQWYLLPLLVLFIVALPARPVILAVACLTIYYATYFNNTCFASMGWNDVVARVAGWKVVHAEVSQGISGSSAGNTLRVVMEDAPRGAVVEMAAPAGITLDGRIALAFDLRDDVDPSFHGEPFDVNVYASGMKADGEDVARFPLLQHAWSATNVGPERFRIPIDGASRISSVLVKVGARTSGLGRHWLSISNIRFVNEPLWDSATAFATFAAVGASLCCLGVLVGGIRVART